MTEPGRYPLEPLADELGIVLGSTGVHIRPRPTPIPGDGLGTPSRLGADPDATVRTIIEMADELGVSHRTLVRWKAHGLTSRQADHLAIHHAHMHPSQLWPAWFDDANIAADCDWPEPGQHATVPEEATIPLHVGHTAG